MIKDHPLLILLHPPFKISMLKHMVHPSVMSQRALIPPPWLCEVNDPLSSHLCVASAEISLFLSSSDEMTQEAENGGCGSVNANVFALRFNPSLIPECKH